MLGERERERKQGCVVVAVVVLLISSAGSDV